jgi:cell division topological specificity factor
MKLFRLFERGSAPVARERLQILLKHERAATGHSGLIAALREEILRVIARHVDVSSEKVKFKLEHGEEAATLQIDVEIPEAAAHAAMSRERSGRAA